MLLVLSDLELQQINYKNLYTDILRPFSFKEQQFINISIQIVTNSVVRVVLYKKMYLQ